MSENRKTTPDDVYFITLTVTGWIDLFTRESYKEIIAANLQYCRQNENLEIFAYVIMSNHLHTICRRRGADLKELLGRFKSFTAKQLLKEIEANPQESRKEWMLKLFQDFAKENKQYSRFHLWQYTDNPVLLYSAEVINQKINYIHQNPVKAGLVTEAVYYKYSSACADNPVKTDEW